MEGRPSGILSSALWDLRTQPQETSGKVSHTPADGYRIPIRPPSFVLLYPGVVSTGHDAGRGVSHNSRLV